MENNNEVYESLLPKDGEKLSGLEFNNSKKTQGQGFVAAGYDARAANLNAPRTQRLADVVGNSDYGNSIYDEQGFSMAQLNDLEDTRANIQPFIDKVGVGLGTFALKTATATAGGIGNIFYGTISAIADQRLRSFYDNALMNGLQEVNEDIDGALKIYQSDSERNGDF